MKVLSVQQPWATMICSGIKDVENRTWKPQENPGRILIHASKKFSMNMLSEMPLEWSSTINNDILFGNLPQANEFPYGAIIGYVTLDRIETESDSLWASPDDSQYKWVFKDAYMFDKPIEGVKGKLHLFDYPIDENNLPAAHKVEIRKPKREGDELVVPLAKANWDEYAKTKDNSDELYLTFDITPNLADILCMPDVYDLLPVQSIRLECEGKSLRYEVDGNSSASYYDVDKDMKHLLYGSIFTDEPIKRVLCAYFFGKKLADGEPATIREWPVYDDKKEDVATEQSTEKEDILTPRFKVGDKVYVTADGCFVNYIPNEYSIRNVNIELDEEGKQVVMYSLKGRRGLVEEKYLFNTEQEAQQDLIMQCLDHMVQNFGILENRSKHLNMEYDSDKLIEMLKEKLKAHGQDK